MYLTNLCPGDEKKDLLVVKESLSLRAIEMLMDNKKMIECIVGPGSQIVAMSEEICHDLGWTYNLTIQLHMQSAKSIIRLIEECCLLDWGNYTISTNSHDQKPCISYSVMKTI
jgi:hypothetical protein